MTCSGLHFHYLPCCSLLTGRDKPLKGMRTGRKLSAGMARAHCFIPLQEVVPYTSFFVHPRAEGYTQCKLLLHHHILSCPSLSPSFSFCSSFLIKVPRESELLLTLNLNNHILWSKTADLWPTLAFTGRNTPPSLALRMCKAVPGRSVRGCPGASREWLQMPFPLELSNPSENQEVLTTHSIWQTTIYSKIPAAWRNTLEETMGTSKSSNRSSS